MVTELAEIVNENVGKNSSDMRYFFQKLIEQKDINLYSLEVNKKTVLKDDEDEQVISVKKGATLIPTDKIKEYQPFILEDVITKNQYYISLSSEGGMVPLDGEQDIYYTCVIEKLLPRIDFRKIDVIRNGLPNELVSSKLVINYTQSDYGDKGKLTVDGELDPLFTKICDYVRNQ